MKKNKISILVLFLICSVILTACGSNTQVISNGKKVNTTSMSHKHCVRSATADAGITVELEYDVYYTDDKLNLLQSTEKVVANKETDLDEYQKAYESINENYAGLEYYDTKVERKETSVIRTTVINYDKIDLNKLLEIEGKDDNVIENGEAKSELWFSLAKKFGAKCEEVEE